MNRERTDVRADQMSDPPETARESWPARHAKTEPDSGGCQHGLRTFSRPEGCANALRLAGAHMVLPTLTP